MARFDTPLLCLVTNRNRCRGRDLEEVVDQAVIHGVGMVQLREKDMPPGDLYDLGARVKEAIAGRAHLIINDRIDVALALNADGVQLPEDGAPVAEARRTVGPNMLIGRSVHSIGGAIEAESSGADFLIAGTIFPSASHPDGPAQGTDFLRSLCREVSIPVLAIGGVTSENVVDVMEAGCSGGAVISAISEAEDPGSAARTLLNEMARVSAI
ncbi:MAG: thiamine phosphate synthase [Chloroflexota bacterium]|nr:thiamine phosphate synthase [Chloroflexota bacterium]